MRFALALSQARGHLAPPIREGLDAFLAGLPVPAIPRGFGAVELFELMSHDKKVRDGRIHFVLLERPGRAVTDDQVRREDLFAAYRLLGLGRAR
jgi:3-dehydroquinate synthetase